MKEKNIDKIMKEYQMIIQYFKDKVIIHLKLIH